MSLLKWAETELEAAGYFADDEDGPNKWLREGTLELLKSFSEQGHSGMSAPFAIRLFTRLASYKPISPLTGEDDEWNEVSEGVWQNRRDSTVFKEKDGHAYTVNGIVFWEWCEDENGKKFKSYFTNGDSRLPVTFPYTVPDSPEYREAKT